MWSNAFHNSTYQDEKTRPEYVAFPTPDEVKIPVPSPVYLVIHAAGGQLAHMSGATKYIGKLNPDIEDSMTLNPNGASVETLRDVFVQLQASRNVAI